MTSITTTATTTTVLAEHLPEFLEAYAVVHRGMRRDARRLVEVADGSRSIDAAGLARWFERFETEVVHHHDREDEIVFPELVRRAPQFAADREVLDEEHHVLDAAMADIRSALASLVAAPKEPARVGQLDVTAQRFETVLNEHLDREEAVVFPLIAFTFTAEGYAALEAQMRKGTPLKAMAFELPWAADDLPADVMDRVFAVLPAPVRFVNRVVFEPAYRRLAAPLRD